MIQDTEQTTVKFLMGPGKDLIAYFVDINYNERLYGESRKQVYAHIGQHVSCTVEYANECRYATKREYRDLQKELEQLGYNLKIINEEL